MITLIRANLKEFAKFIIVSLMATSAVGYFGYEFIFSPVHAWRTSEPINNYQWELNQYFIQFERLDNQTLKYSSKIDTNIEALRLRNKLLQGKFGILKDEAPRVSSLISGIPLHGSLEKLEHFMNEVSSDIEELGRNPATINTLIVRFENMRDTVTSLADTVHFADLQYRKNSLVVLEDKLNKLYACLMLVWVILSAGLGIFLLRLKSLRQQSESSLLAEHRAEEALADAIVTKNTILGTISHELKTPLQTIMSSIDLLASRLSNERDLRVVNRLLAAAERLEAQMEDLTDYARLGAGKMVLRRIEFDPGELLDRVVNEFQEVAKSNNLDLVMRRKKQAALVISDARRIEQIAGNLITNAIKYTPSGRIQVSLDIVEHGTPELHLVVEDTGPGISADKVPSLFEPFTQLDQSRTRKYDGAGMGLAIVRRLVDLFGGRIDVQSKLGRGTRFEVDIPVEVLAFERSTAEPTPSSEPARQRILLVDDNAEVRTSMQDILTEIGYVADVADGGKVALQKLATHSYDAILLDISMPEMDGFEVAAAVRATQGANQTIPIVALSAYAPERLTADQRTHFTTHIGKPVRLEALHQILAEVLRKK